MARRVAALVVEREAFWPGIDIAYNASSADRASFQHLFFFLSFPLFVGVFLQPLYNLLLLHR